MAIFIVHFQANSGLLNQPLVIRPYHSHTILGNEMGKDTTHSVCDWSVYIYPVYIYSTILCVCNRFSFASQQLASLILSDFWSEN